MPELLVMMKLVATLRVAMATAMQSDGIKVGARGEMKTKESKMDQGRNSSFKP